jgi:hypothetical protein
MSDDDIEWPGKLIYNPENGTITWRREIMAKEMKAKKEVKKPKMVKHDDKKQDMAMMKKAVKKGCMK